MSQQISHVARIQRHLEQIAEFTATPGAGTTRMSYSDQDAQTRHYLKAQMQQIGLNVREDAMGNIFGRLEGANANLPAVMIGSHFDSVPNGGAFDGPAGVVMGLEVATLFYEQQLKPHYPLEVVALVEEEGASFGSALLASRAIAGKVSAADLKRMKNQQGQSAAECMARLGFNAEQVDQVVRPATTIKAFIELHIEQGPVLEQAGEDIGLVDVIVGITQLVITLHGRAGHAGTTPMNHRADALLAASKVIQKISEFATHAGEGCVATVGKLQVLPNGANVIPDKVVFTVDIRSRNAERLNELVEQINAFTYSIAQGGITSTIEQPLSVRPTPLTLKFYSYYKRIAISWDYVVAPWLAVLGMMR